MKLDKKSNMSKQGTLLTERIEAMRKNTLKKDSLQTQKKTFDIGRFIDSKLSPTKLINPF